MPRVRRNRRSHYLRRVLPVRQHVLSGGKNLAEVGLKRYRYTAEERDEETGLYYLGARYYACWLGRWTACDPLGISDGLNLFAYVRGNPISRTDPSGTQGDDQNDSEPPTYHFEPQPPIPGLIVPDFKLVPNIPKPPALPVLPQLRWDGNAQPAPPEPEKDDDSKPPPQRRASIKVPIHRILEIRESVSVYRARLWAEAGRA